MHTGDLNVQGTLRVQLPISNNASVSSNFLYANDDPNLLFSANLHLNSKASMQPRIGVGVNIVHNAPHMDGGILGDRTSPILNLGVDVKLSKQLILFGDADYAFVGNSDGNSGSLAIVSGLGFRFSSVIYTVCSARAWEE